VLIGFLVERVEPPTTLLADASAALTSPSTWRYPCLEGDVALQVKLFHLRPCPAAHASMPRGAPHHVMVRGVDRRPIFREDTERVDFVLGGHAAVLRNHMDVSVPLCG
jgi:hypothetical protein